jgi:hypothetical protein
VFAPFAQEPAAAPDCSRTSGPSLRFIAAKQQHKGKHAPELERHASPRKTALAASQSGGNWLCGGGVVLSALPAPARTTVRHLRDEIAL